MTHRCIIIAGFCIALLGCFEQSDEARECREVIDAQLYDGPRLAINDALSAFPSQDVPTQYQIYLCTSTYMHPPLTHFLGPFARGGDRSAEYVVARLHDGVSDRAFVAILEVFHEMRRIQSFDASDDSELMRGLADRADKIAEPDWMAYAHRLLEGLRSPLAESPSTQ